VMITPTVDAESGEEKSEPEPEPAKVWLCTGWSRIR
jgi:hypothetical protein